MRIALVAPPWNPVPPPKYGGTETVVDNLARALHRAGHDVHLFAPESSTCPVPKTLIPKGSQPYAFSPVCIESSYVMSIVDQLRDFDVIHDNTILAPLFAQRLPYVPMVTTNHAPFMGDINTIYRHLPPNVKVVGISHSQSKRAEFPVDVVHHGVDHEYFGFGEGKGDDNGEYFLFLGRMAEIKGVRIAVEAARAAGKRLLIAAKMHEPAEFEYFHSHIEPLLTEKVRYIGEVGGGEKVRLLQGARALLNPFVWEEPFGLVMTEALACGTPVIAFKNGSASEIVDDGSTGFLCSSEFDLPDAIHNIDQIDRKQCRKSVDGYFNVDRMAAEYVAIYRKLVAARDVIDLTTPASAPTPQP